MITKSADQPRCVRPAEAAMILGVCRDTVYTLMRSGELRSVHIGRARLIPVQAIDDLINDRLREG